MHESEKVRMRRVAPARIFYMADVTMMLQAIDRGDPSAASQLLPLIYDELRRLAAARMSGESPDHTLEPTALVHEAYVRLTGSSSSDQWDSRGHFFAAASEAMRRILVEAARRKQSEKHGGQSRRVVLDPNGIPDSGSPEYLLAVDEALERLQAEHADAAALVKLRYFAGLTQKEAAASLQLPRRTADRYWAFAKAWLYEELRGIQSDG